MTNNTIPHDHHHRLRPHHHEEMDQLQPLSVKPQAKSQARRRTHTSRPYQERLLNMAEARREIVTALKIHRATTSSTKQQQQQQSTYQHHQQPPLLQLQQQQQEQEQQEEQQQQVQVAFQDRSRAAVAEEAPLSHTTTMSCAAAAAAAAAFGNPLLRDSPIIMHWIAAAGRYCSPAVLPCDLTPPEPELPPTAAMGGLVELEEHYQYQGGLDLERLVRSLPARPLGLNLSFQGFGVSVDDGAAVAKDDDCEDYLFGSLPLAQPSPAASYSYSYSAPAVETTATTTHGYDGHGSPALSAAGAENHHPDPVIDAPAPALIPVVPDDGGEKMMAQASTGGEMQGVEWWSEAAAAADVAAWWSKIFDSESGQRAPPNAEDVAATAAGLPPEKWPWLCGDDVGAAEQGAVTGAVLATTVPVDDGDYSCCYEGGRSDDGEDVTLPCMDGIGDDDVQEWDGEWFSCS